MPRHKGFNKIEYVDCSSAIFFSPHVFSVGSVKANFLNNSGMYFGTEATLPLFLRQMNECNEQAALTLSLSYFISLLLLLLHLLLFTFTKLSYFYLLCSLFLYALYYLSICVYFIVVLYSVFYSVLLVIHIFHLFCYRICN